MSNKKLVGGEVPRSIEELAEEELEIYNRVRDAEIHGLIRGTLRRGEVKIVNRLVKMGFVFKGYSDDRRKSKAFFTSSPYIID